MLTNQNEFKSYECLPSIYETRRYVFMIFIRPGLWISWYSMKFYFTIQSLELLIFDEEF